MTTGRAVPRSKPQERERSGAHESCCRSYTTPGVRPKRPHSRSRTSLGVCACASRSPWPRGARPTLEWARCADSAGLTQVSGQVTAKWVVPTREQTNEGKGAETHHPSEILAPWKLDVIGGLRL